ncbi:Homologous-pairing protein 2 like [Schistosoma japonicum]|nr:Homologous-pairing protein 2 like [Schistosoma japonicum]KAH8868966.1 Homologous-pairing protein 2 like [Schistosoma japonicum]
MSNSSCKDDVLKFFEKENRPFSLVDVCGVLKNHGKTAISKALDDLSEEGSIKEKAYGKQKVYVYDQTKLPLFDENELKKMEAQSTNLSVELAEEQKKLKSLVEEFKKVTSSLTKEEAEKELIQVNEKLNKVKAEVAALKSKGPGITEADLRSAMNIIDAVAESYPSSKKQLMSDIGIETDEDYGVSIPN